MASALGPAQRFVPFWAPRAARSRSLPSQPGRYVLRSACQGSHQKEPGKDGADGGVAEEDGYLQQRMRAALV